MAELGWHLQLWIDVKDLPETIPALKALAEQQRRDWQIRMVNLREILEPIDVFHRITGVRVEDPAACCSV